MISIYEKSNTRTNNEGDTKELEFRGLSTDEKPVEIGDKDISNGSVFIEIDTGKIYFFDLENKEWKEA